MKKVSLVILIFISLGFTSRAQTNICEGSYTTIASNCQSFTIGDGTPGYIEVCFDVDNIPSGGGSSCSPGCAPYTPGGGFAPRIAIHDSGGNIIGNFVSGTATPTCIIVPVNDGVADIYGLCLSAGSEISWQTVDECGNNVCNGAPPPCYPPGTCDCTNPCGPACGWATVPTVPQVTANCTEYAYLPELGPLTNSSSCYTFIAASASVDFGVIVTSDCGAGNVTGFTWDVYTTGSCGTAVQSGTLASLTMSPMIIGQSYTFCYDFTTPNCTHTSHYPYFVGASALPVVFTDFTGELIGNSVNLKWDIESEEDNAFYMIESSRDGKAYELLSIVESEGDPLVAKTYTSTDFDPKPGMNYYKLTQVDHNGAAKELKTVLINYIGDSEFIAEYINVYGLGGALIESINVKDQNILDKLRSSNFQGGFYIVEMVGSNGNTKSFKYFKDSQ